jgi:hypothetical protein
VSTERKDLFVVLVITFIEGVKKNVRRTKARGDRRKYPEKAVESRLVSAFDARLVLGIDL